MINGLLHYGHRRDYSDKLLGRIIPERAKKSRKKNMKRYALGASLGWGELISRLENVSQILRSQAVVSSCFAISGLGTVDRCSDGLFLDI
jgi:hypothetical protein